MSPTGVERPRRPGRSPLRRVAALLVLAAAGCAAPEEPPAPKAPEPVIAAPPARPVPRAPQRKELCPVLASVASNDTAGFSELRGRPIGPAHWIGTATLPGTERCRIEGRDWPRARYVCDGGAFAAEGRARAEAAFETLAGAIDRCLARPIWFPRDWRRSEPFEFAMGERLQTWIDESTSPPSAVVLKVHQDLTHHDYRLRVALETAR